MAVLKTLIAPSGLEVENAYWMPGEINIQHRAKIITARVDVYLSKEARDEDKAPLAQIIVTVPSEEYDTVIEGGIPALYESLKQRELAGGIDA